MNARIGKLVRQGNEVFYTYIDGVYIEGSQERVEAALGLRAEVAIAVAPKAPSNVKTYNVHLTFQYPAWDEKEGIWYMDIPATSKKRAIEQVRSEARGDGHAVGGRGLYWFKAVEQE